MKFTVVSESGQIVSVLTVPNRKSAELNLKAGQRLFDGDFDARSQYFSGDTPTAIPESPGDWAEFDFAQGVWVDPRSEAEILQIQWDDLRAKRDQLLKKCDWTQMPDSPLSAEAVLAWKEYRQKLRDLPDNTANPGDINWPISPDYG